MTSPSSNKPVTPERIMQFAWGYTAPLMIEAAIRHRVFDHLDGGAKTVEQVATAAQASPRGIRMLLDGLVGLDLLRKDQGHYALTAESARSSSAASPASRAVSSNA